MLSASNVYQSPFADYFITHTTFIITFSYAPCDAMNYHQTNRVDDSGLWWHTNECVDTLLFLNHRSPVGRAGIRVSGELSPCRECVCG